MKKRITAILLIAIMLIALIPSTAFAATSGTCGDGVSWTLKNKVLTISGNGDMKDYSMEKLPPWYSASAIEKIVIKEGVKSIGEFAFMGNTENADKLKGTLLVKTIQIPSTVTDIGAGAFYACFSLESINVSENNETFANDDQGVLYDKNMEYLLWIPGGKTGELYIPATVMDMGIDSLLYTYGITKYRVDKNNQFFESDKYGAISTKGGETLLMVAKGAHSYAFNDKVKSIALPELVFNGCINIGSVYLPEFVTDIPSYMFANCETLHIVGIPKAVATIGEDAFLGCKNLEMVYFNGSETVWNAIQIGSGNDYLLKAKKDFICDHPNKFIYKEFDCDNGTIYMCADCGSKIATGGPGHQRVKYPDVPATCTENGYLGGEYCEVCEMVLWERTVVPAVGHTEKTIPAVQATCSSTGLTEGKECLLCKEITVKQTQTPKADHSGEWVVIKEATQTEKGTKSRICTVCGEVETVEYSLYKKGDVNKDGSVDAKDATQILRFVNGKASSIDGMSDVEKFALGDVNGDESVDAKDATQILRHVNGKASKLDPVQ